MGDTIKWHQEAVHINQSIEVMMKVLVQNKLYNYIFLILWIMFRVRKFYFIYFRWVRLVQWQHFNFYIPVRSHPIPLYTVVGHALAKEKPKK